jgi:hypothetical protein
MLEEVTGIWIKLYNEELHNFHFPADIIHSWIRAVLEKLPIVQLLKNFSALYGTRRFITAFT